MKKTIVISAVNLNVGGTLAILRDCLAYLSEFTKQSGYKVVAIVYDKKLVEFPEIEYIETQWPKKNWFNRIWYEYVSLKQVSRQIGPIELWLSLHDTTPNVKANRRAVYCHNPFPFYQWNRQELFKAPKIVLFSLFSKFIYKHNIHKNDHVIVQQQWIKQRFKQMFGLAKERIVVALPMTPTKFYVQENSFDTPYTEFIYPASANSHKNFECLCSATDLLNSAGIINFKVYLTLNGDENVYAAWLRRKWGHVKSLEFIGFLDKDQLQNYYAKADCLVFPSKVETWGLPISEFSRTSKPMLLADLPYAYETAAGNDSVAFFDPNSPEKLAQQMGRIIQKNQQFLQKVEPLNIEDPKSNSWQELFDILLN